MKLDFLTWFISALCCYRITVLISRDLVFKWLRQLPYIGVWAKCPFCTSPYMASLVCVGLYFSGFRMSVAMWIILAGSFSAFTIPLDRIFTGDYQPK